jgi:hypothetical protein
VRILRVPGTFNRKIADAIKQVCVRMPSIGDPKRYEHDDFEPFYIADEFNPDSVAAKTVHYEFVEPVTVGESHGIPEKVMLLCENDKKFKKTWARDRTDMQDQSASAYDMAVANTMVLAGCGDQEIADAIMAWRKHHHEDTKKAHRRDYLMRTIGKARNLSEADKAMTEVLQDDVIPEQLPPPPAKGAPAEPPKPEDEVKKEEVQKLREERYTRASKMLGIELEAVLKFGNEKPIFFFRLKTGDTIKVGSAKQFNNQNAVRDEVLARCGINFRAYKGEVWRRLVQLLVQVCEWYHEEDDSDTARLRECLRRYTGNFKGTLKHASQTVSPSALHRGKPFIYKGQLWVTVAEFAVFLRRVCDWREITDNEIRQLLKGMRFKPEKKTARLRNRKTLGRYCWGAPVDDLTDIMPFEAEEAAAEEVAEADPEDFLEGLE